MNACPNPDCHHRRMTGRPAEFIDSVDHCSDCGSVLVPQVPPDPPRPRLPFPKVLIRWLSWTGGVVLVLWAGLFLPMPFLGHDVPLWLMGQLSVPTAIERGPMSLGVTPFLLGFVLVELVALAIPGLRRRRHGDADLRRPLTRASLIADVGIYTSWATRAQAWLQPDNPWFVAGECVVLAVCVPIGSLLYYWRRRKVFRQPPYRRHWILSQVYSAAFLLALLIAGYQLARIQNRSVGEIVPLVALFVLAALADDFVSEFRARRNAPRGADLVPAETWQDMADAVDAFRDRSVEGACL